jgi:hypothetical protein
MVVVACSGALQSDERRTLMEVIFLLAAVATIVTAAIRVYEWFQERKRRRDEN